MPGFDEIALQLTYTIFAFLLFFISVIGFGSAGVRLLKLSTLENSCSYIYASALGLGIFSHLIFLLLALGFLYRWSVQVLIVLGFILFLFDVYSYREKYRNLYSSLRGLKLNWFLYAAILLIVFFWFFPLFLHGFLPPIGYDEVAYHLAIPKIYIQNHTLSYIPFIPHSNWPLETEMLFAVGLLISNEIFTHLVNWGCFLLVSVSLFVWGRRFFGVLGGAVAAALFTFTPMVLKLAGTAMVEMPLALYSFLATISLIDGLDNEKSNELILSAIFAGLAASTKLNAVIVPISLGVFAFFSMSLKNHLSLRSSLKKFFLYGLISLLVVSPWYIKSFVQTGNPVWPFFYPIFDGRNWDQFGSSNLMNFIYLPNMAINLKNWVFTLWVITIEPARFGGLELGYFYVLLMPLSMLAMFFTQEATQRNIIKSLFVIVLIYYTAWFLQTHQTRFLMPALPIIALLSASGIFWIWQKSNCQIRTVIEIGLIVSFLVSGLGTINASFPYLKNNWLFLTGRISRDELIERYIPGFDTFVYANKNLPQNSLIWMALWESRGYYLDKKYSWANPIGQRVIKLEEMKSPEELAKVLNEQGITHILLQRDNLNNFPFYPDVQKITELTLSMIAKSARLIYKSGSLELYEFGY